MIDCSKNWIIPTSAAKKAPRAVNFSKVSFFMGLEEKMLWITKKSGKMENKKNSFLIPQLIFSAKNKEKAVKNKNETNRKKIKLLGIIIFLFFRQSISQVKKSRGIITLTEAKSIPVVGLRAI